MEDERAYWQRRAQKLSLKMAQHEVIKGNPLHICAVKRRRESCALVHLGIEYTLRWPIYRGKSYEEPPLPYTLSVNHFIHQTRLTSLTVSAHVHPQGFCNTNLLHLSGELEYQNRHVQDLSCLVIIHRSKPASALSILIIFPEIFTLPPLV